MNFKKMEAPKIDSQEEESLDILRLIAGRGIRVHFENASVNASIGNLEGCEIEGVLDSGIELGHPIYLDNGKKHTPNVLGVLQKNGHIYVKTEKATYKFTVDA